jgi:hypothetical protein
LADGSTQTDNVTTCSIEVQTEPSPGQVIQPAEVKVKQEEEGEEPTKKEEVEKEKEEEADIKVEKVRRTERAKQEVKRLIERLERTKRGPAVSCEFCKMKYKKIYKLRFHLMKQHLKEIAERLRTEKEPGRISFFLGMHRIFGRRMIRPFFTSGTPDSTAGHPVRSDTGYPANV